MPSTGRIVITTHGTAGDLLPYLAIGRVLRARGYEVLVASSAAFEATVLSNGLEFVPLPPDVPSADEMSQFMDPHRGTEWLFRHHLLPPLSQTVDALLAATRGAVALVSHSTSLAAPLVAELGRPQGLKWVSGVVSPLALFSRHDPPALPVAPWAVRVPPYQQFLLFMIERQLGMYLKPVRAERLRRGLTPGINPLFVECHSPQLALGLFSEHLAPRQSDWPGSLRTTGYCFLDGAHTLPSDALAFLDAGPAPVVFATASFSPQAPRDWAGQSVAAARALGHRSVLLGVEPALDAAPDVWQGNFLPLAPLLPRAAAFVHQGGAGAFAQGLRAAVPMVLSPLSHDQPDTARMAVRAGVASVVARRQYGTPALVDALRHVIQDEGQFRARNRLKVAISSDGGAESAADAICGQLV